MASVTDDKTREKSLWKWLEKAKLAFGPALHMERVENYLEKGTPDVEGCLNYGSFHIELKTSPRPSKPGTRIKPKYQDGQPEWHEKRIRAGGRVFSLVQVGSGAGASRYLLWGDFSARLAKDGMSEAELASVSVVDPKASAPEVVRAASRTT
jgi:hypothetical protein